MKEICGIYPMRRMKFEKNAWKMKREINWVPFLGVSISRETSLGFPLKIDDS